MISNERTYVRNAPTVVTRVVIACVPEYVVESMSALARASCAFNTATTASKEIPNVVIWAEGMLKIFRDLEDEALVKRKQQRRRRQGRHTLATFVSRETAKPAPEWE